MANIPVEKKSGAGWLPWLLGILALIALIWLGAELFDEEPDLDEIAGTENNVGPIDDVELDAPDFDLIDTDADLYDPIATGAYVADVEVDEMEVQGADVDGDGEIERAGAGRGDARIGSVVDLDEARVLSVVGDSAFFVGTDEGRRVLVVLENLGESQAGAGGTDGVFNVDEGETVSIEGSVARYVEGARGTWELPDAERDRMLRQGLYVRVNDRSDIAMMQ